jgi:hypothetical protein
MSGEDIEVKLRRLSSPLLGIVSGIFLFECVSGAAVTLRPAMGAWLQWNVLLHTVLGLILLVPLTVYSWSHWRRASASDQKNMIWIGYATLAVVALSGLSGLWAAGAACFAERVPAWVRSAHLWSSWAAAALVATHLTISLRRLRSLSGADASSTWRASSARMALWAGGSCVAAAALTLALAGLPVTPRYQDGPPAGYSFKYGPNPFAPSNAMTASGTIIDSRRLSGSQACGDCHQQIYQEWKSSAHRWSSTDPAFRAVEKKMIAENGQEATRYCAGCHNPVGLLAGANNPGTSLDSPGSDEGSSCVVCHSIRSQNGTSQGNGNYLLAPPRDYLFTRYMGSLGKQVNYFLVRSMPTAHKEDLAREFHGTPELCSVCHKQFIDKEVNHFGWVQLQNQYDDWRKGHYHVEGHPEKTLECRDCHMRLMPSNDPARLANGMHHSHRFIAANQTVPLLLGDTEQVRLTEEWLQGRAQVPEIASRWAKGPVVPIRIDAPSAGVRGKKLSWQVIVTNNKVGHNFPTGPLDLIETWLEVTVLDSKGRELFHSGFLDDRNYVDKNAFFFRSLGVSKEGKLIDRHNLWDMVGQKYKRAIFVGASDAAAYELRLPKDCAGPVKINARLRYRKFNQFIVDWVTGKKDVKFPITDLSQDQATIALGPSGEHRAMGGQ